jgi:Secretion system C-terminal sorting domain
MFFGYLLPQNNIPMGSITINSLRTIIIFSGLVISVSSFAQTTRTNTSAGSLWFDGGAGWSAGVPANNATTFNNNAKATILNAQSAVAASFTAGNGAELIINTGGQLTVNGNFTTNNGTIITIAGNLIINGNLIVNNNLTWNVTGTVQINGNIQVANNSSITIAGGGAINSTGNFTGGNNTAVVLNGGNLNLAGSITVGAGSTATGTGGVATFASCSGGGAFCANLVALPISLIYFKGSGGALSAKLEWATASELNFDYFDIEKSSDGTTFQSIAKVKGNGTTNLRHDYSFTDEKPLIGKNYYRLKSVDFDGYTEYFKVVMVDFDGKKNFSVYPNPSDGISLNIETNFTPLSKGFVVVYNAVGAMVARFEVSGSASTLTMPMKLESGVYFAKYISSDFTSTCRVLVK